MQRCGDNLFGRIFPLRRAIVGGLGELRVEDVLWLISGPDLSHGTLVRVTGQDGALLHVEPAVS